MRRISLATTLAVIAALPAAAAPLNAITDGGFEAPALATGGSAYPLATSNGWNFVTDTGVINASGASSWYGTTSPTGFTGNQYGFVQRSGSLSQTFTAPATGTLDITWLEGSRPGYRYFDGQETYQVLLDGIPEGSYSTPNAENFTPRHITGISLIAGSIHTLTFQGTKTTDSTAFIDQVAVSVPEPNTLTLFAAALGSLTTLRRRPRR